MSATRWEIVRDKFIKQIDSIVGSNKDSGEDYSDTRELTVVTKEEKRKYDLAAEGIIELDGTGDDDRQLLNAIEALGWSDEVFISK